MDMKNEWLDKNVNKGNPIIPLSRLNVSHILQDHREFTQYQPLWYDSRSVCN